MFATVTNALNFTLYIERRINMFLASEATTTFTAPEFLLALFQAVAFVVTMIAVKAAFYRRRMREENEKASPTQRQREPCQSMERLARASSCTSSDKRSLRGATASKSRISRRGRSAVSRP